MKYVRVCLASLLFVASTLFSYQIRLLDQKKIDQHAVGIEKKITRDYYVRLALMSMVAARITYGLVTWLNTPHEKKSENLIPVQKKEESIEAPQITWGEWAHNKKISWINWAKYVVSQENITKQAIGLGQFMVTNSLQTGIGFVFEGVYGKLNYPNTLRWYICCHVPYTATIKVIKEMMQPLQDYSLLTPDQLHYNQQLLQESCNRLVSDGEKLCGYMTYKTKQLDIEEQQIAERTTRHFITYYNEFLNGFSDQLASDTVDYNALDSMLTSFEADIKRQLRLFFYIEGETDQERAMIGERVKRSLLIEQIATLF